MEEISVARGQIDARSAKYAEAYKAATDSATALKTFVAENTALIREHESKIKAAQEKSDLLNNSGCPMPDKATCGFLSDARTANDSLPALLETLGKMKADARAKYTELESEAKAAKDALAAITDPKAELNRLTEEESRRKPIAALAPRLEAAAATVAELDKQEKAYRECHSETQIALAEIAAKMPDLEEKAARADKLRTEIWTHEPTAKLLPQCTAAAATVEALTGRIAALRKDIDDITAKADAAHAEAKQIRDRMSLHDNHMDDLVVLRRKLVEK
jgi:exonuclease SbcC